MNERRKIPDGQRETSSRSALEQGEADLGVRGDRRSVKCAGVPAQTQPVSKSRVVACGRPGLWNRRRRDHWFDPCDPPQSGNQVGLAIRGSDDRRIPAVPHA
jgi:hypothetical protein